MAAINGAAARLNDTGRTSPVISVSTIVAPSRWRAVSPLGLRCHAANWLSDFNNIRNGLGSRLPLLIHKHVFVAAVSIRGSQFYELEAFFAIELKDIAGGGYFEWVASNPVNDIEPG